MAGSLACHALTSFYVMRGQVAANTSAKAGGCSHAYFPGCFPLWEILSLRLGLCVPQKMDGKSQVAVNRFPKNVPGEAVTITWHFTFGFSAGWRSSSLWGDSLDHVINYSTSLETNCAASSSDEFCGCLIM